MYFINGIPYTFDEVEESYYFDPEIIEWANENTAYDLEDLYQWSYLVMEECHPLLFELELENPELLPSRLETVLSVINKPEEKLVR